jgi:hypothetical protein
LSSLTAIRAGLAANLSSRIKGTQVSAYWLANPTPPCLEVFPDSVEGTQYHQAMVNGLHRWNLAVRGMVQNNEAESAQRTLDKWLADTGADSVFAALESDTTLGGAAGGLVVRGHTGYQEYAREGLAGTVLAVVWQVEVLAAGS